MPNSGKPKSIVIAQCDAHVTNKVVMKAGKKVRSMVESIPETDFEMCRLDNRFKRGYNLLTNCYKDATDSGFHFEHDAFGGYGLFLGGDDLYVNKKKDFLLPGLHALLQTVNDEDVDKFEPISIFARTDLCRKSRIMVGPVRFANHSCKPNSEYVASS